MNIESSIGRVSTPHVGGAGENPSKMVRRGGGDSAEVSVGRDPQAPSAHETAPPARTAEQQKEMRRAIDEINRSLKNLHVSRQFEVDESSGQMVITLYDTEKGEKIRQIPNDFDLKRISEVKKYLGVLYDDNA